ncbi:MAG: quercetin 2,3-dioxygenase, partial [Actinomycetota bacterium]|nr:quercetin 2,3-dioxygenase [Actinomycetota bacterium]
QLVVLGRDGQSVIIEADETADVLLLGGRPLHEPVAWYGPFVMNTKQEIVDSLELFETGKLGSIPPRSE